MRKMGQGAARLRKFGAAIASLLLVNASVANAETLEDLCGQCQFEKFASCGDFLEGVNVDRDGVMWAVSLFSSSILRVEGGKCETAAKTGGKPNSSRFGPDGKLYLTDNVRGILVFDTKTKAITVFADKVDGKPIENANDIAFDQNGGFYVTVPGTSNFIDRTGSLIYFPPGSNQAKTLLTGLAYPNGVTIAPDGQFVDVGLFGIKTIITIPSQLNPAGRRPPYAHVITQGGVGPDGIAYDAKGRLFWAQFLAGAVGVTDDRGFVLGYMKLPDTAGRWTTNLTFHDGYIYVTEAEKGEIWRTKIATTGADQFKLKK